MGFIAQEGGMVRLGAAAGETVIITPLEHVYQVLINFNEVINLDKNRVNEIRIETDGQVSFTPSTHLHYLNSLFADLGIKNGICVDVGAYDGLNYSHVLPLYQHGWKGLSVECDPNRFARLAHAYRMFPSVRLSRARATPQSICSLLAGNHIPKDFDFLNLDIDSYDYYVLEALLQDYHPTVICAEINEVIPPPIKFAVKYDPSFGLDFKTRFFGQSLAMIAELAQKHGYKILKMHYNDVFLIDGQYAEGETPLAEIYAEGFSQLPRHSYYKNYPFDVNALQDASPEEGLAMVEKGFAQYQGKFELFLGS